MKWKTHQVSIMVLLGRPFCTEYHFYAWKTAAMLAEGEDWGCGVKGLLPSTNQLEPGKAGKGTKGIRPKSFPK